MKYYFKLDGTKIISTIKTINVNAQEFVEVTHEQVRLSRRMYCPHLISGEVVERATDEEKIARRWAARSNYNNRVVTDYLINKYRVISDYAYLKDIDALQENDIDKEEFRKAVLYVRHKHLVRMSVDNVDGRLLMRDILSGKFDAKKPPTEEEYNFEALVNFRRMNPKTNNNRMFTDENGSKYAGPRSPTNSRNIHTIRVDKDDKIINGEFAGMRACTVESKVVSLDVVSDELEKQYLDTVKEEKKSIEDRSRRRAENRSKRKEKLDKFFAKSEKRSI